MSATTYNSLAEAGAAVGAAKSTILKAIRRGLISATRTEAGGWQIEPAELHRVFAPVSRETSGNEEKRDGELAELRARLADAHDQIAFLRRTQEELSAERARLTAMLLSDQRPRRPWWRFGRR